MTSQLLSHTLRHPLLRIPLYNRMVILLLLALVPSVSFVAHLQESCAGFCLAYDMYGQTE